jgi:hypothetical protein
MGFFLNKLWLYVRCEIFRLHHPYWSNETFGVEMQGYVMRCYDCRRKMVMKFGQWVEE